MKVVGYQQPTCLCLMMEFVVWTISLSCELCSLSEAAFVHEAGTIVYGKRYLDLHVQCCGSCMVCTGFSTQQYTCV